MRVAITLVLDVGDLAIAKSPPIVGNVSGAVIADPIGVGSPINVGVAESAAKFGSVPIPNGRG